MMENNKKIVPEIRFPGFTDPWEQRKLPEFVTFYNGLTYTPDDVRDEGTLVLRSSNVKNGSVIDADNVYVDPNKANSENVKDGDIIVVVRNGSRALIGKHAEIKGTMPNTVIGAFMTGIRSDYPSFVNALLDTPQFDKEIEKNMGATINQITGYMFSKMEFYIPSSPDEQKQIGALFRSLDDAITLHQRKCDEMKTYKKALLQQVFPQPGELFPRVRFPGFTEPWEQRKLAFFLDEKNCKTSKFDEYPLYSLTIEDGITPKTERYERSFLVRKQEDLFKVVEPGWFVTNPMNLRFGALGFNRNAYAVSVSGYYDVFEIDSNKCNDFWYSYFKTPNTIKYFDDSATGSLIEKRRVKYSTLKGLMFLVPSNIEERIMIGNFFLSIDNLITLHQRKCDELKVFKRGLLQQMFV